MSSSSHTDNIEFPDPLTSPIYDPSLLAGLLDGILCPHRTDVSLC